MHQEVWRMSCSFVCRSVSEVNTGFERSVSASSFLLCLYFCETVWKKFLLWLHFVLFYCFMNLGTCRTSNICRQQFISVVLGLYV